MNYKKHLAILLYAIIGSLLLTMIGQAMYGPTLKLPLFFLPFLFGILTLAPLIYFLGGRALSNQKKILAFIAGCTLSQVLTYIITTISYISFILLSMTSFMIANWLHYDDKVLVEIVFYIYIVLLPAVVGAIIVLLWQHILFEAKNTFLFKNPEFILFEAKNVVLFKKPEFIKAMVYFIVFPVALSFFVDITSAFSELIPEGGSGRVDTGVYLKLSFFWQVGMLYFIGVSFAKYAASEGPVMSESSSGNTTTIQ